MVSNDPVLAGLTCPQRPAKGLGPGALSCLPTGLATLAWGHSPCNKGLLGPGPPQLPVCLAPLLSAFPAGGLGHMQLLRLGCDRWGLTGKCGPGYPSPQTILEGWTLGPGGFHDSKPGLEVAAEQGQQRGLGGFPVRSLIYSKFSSIDSRVQLCNPMDCSTPVQVFKATPETRPQTITGYTQFCIHSLGALRTSGPDFPGGPVVKTLAFHPLQGPWVQSLVRELRSHM